MEEATRSWGKKSWHMQGLFHEKYMYDDEMTRHLIFICALSNSKGKKMGVAHGP